MKSILKITIIAIFSMLGYSLYGSNAPLFGLHTTIPQNFFRNTLGVSIELAMIIYFFVMIFFCWLYLKFNKNVKIRLTLLRGATFGFIFFLVFTEFLIALLNLLGGLPKEPDILMRSISFLIAHLISGIITAYGFELLDKLPFFKKNNL